MRGRRIRLGVAVTAVALSGSGLLAGAVAADRGPKVDRVVIKGDVGQRLRLSAADLAALPQYSATVTFLAGSTPQTHTYTGPLLLDVLNLAQPDFDPAIKNDKLRHHVSVEGSDGYEVVVAWGEFDPDFEAKQLLVAITEDGVALGDAGPRLVVPNDKRGGRYVTDVVSIRLGPGDRE